MVNETIEYVGDNGDRPTGTVLLTPINTSTTEQQWVENGGGASSANSNGVEHQQEREAGVVETPLMDVIGTSTLTDDNEGRTTTNLTSNDDAGDFEADVYDINVGTLVQADNITNRQRNTNTNPLNVLLYRNRDYNAVINYMKCERLRGRNRTSRNSVHVLVTNLPSSSYSLEQGSFPVRCKPDRLQAFVKAHIDEDAYDVFLFSKEAWAVYDGCERDAQIRSFYVFTALFLIFSGVQFLSDNLSSGVAACVEDFNANENECLEYRKYFYIQGAVFLFLGIIILFKYKSLFPQTMDLVHQKLGIKEESYAIRQYKKKRYSFHLSQMEPTQQEDGILV